MNPETVWAYEIGGKYEFSRAIRLNTALYYYALDDLQLNARTFTATGITTKLTNATSGTDWGGEVELEWQATKHFLVEGGVGLVNTAYGHVTSNDPVTNAVVDVTRKSFIQAAPYTANLTATYTVAVGPGDLALQGQLDSVGKAHFDLVPNHYDTQNAYALAGTRLTYSVGPTQFALWVRNLTDVRYLTSSSVRSQFAEVAAFYGDPRTFGATLSAKF